MHKDTGRARNIAAAKVNDSRSFQTMISLVEIGENANSVIQNTSIVLICAYFYGTSNFRQTLK